MLHTIPARSLVKILDAADRRGVSAAAACAAADIDPAAVADYDRRLSFAGVVRLYEACARLSGDAAFGLHVGEASHLGMFDVVGYVTMHSPTVGEALRRLERYQRVWTDGALLSSSVVDGVARIEYVYEIADPGREDRRQDCEATLAIVTTAVRALVEPGWQPQLVSCEHTAPGDTTEHARVFRCPIAFGQASNALTFAPDVLAREIPRADPALSAVLDRHAQALLPATPRGAGTADRVRDVLVAALRRGDPDLPGVARELGMSTRTLQRRLRDEETSLHALVDGVRRELSMRYLQQPDLAIADVAYLVGFAEPSAFHRAFRKWTGTTPGAFKRRQSGR